MSDVEQLQALYAQEAEAVALSPLSVAARKRLATMEFVLGRAEAALQQIALALCLPVAAEEVATLALDLAILVPAVISSGQEALLDMPRFRWALAAHPEVAEAARKQFYDSLSNGNPLQLGGDDVVKTIRWFDRMTETGASILPRRNGRPHLDVVWYEITNHCNQKCTFCPDSLRVGPRVNVRLEDFKRHVDDLAANFSVGSMQFNVYGEAFLNADFDQMLAYLREKGVRWPTFITTHGLTLVPAILKKLSNNYPSGIAISLQNDGQESYAATRSAKLGDYDTMVSRVGALMAQMLAERANCHVRVYQMFVNPEHLLAIDPDIVAAFPQSGERLRAVVRQWEERARELVAAAPPEARAQVVVSSDEAIAQAHRQGKESRLPFLRWRATNGRWEWAFITFRALVPYGRQIPLPEDSPFTVKPRQFSRPCGFVAQPSLAIRATGHLGVCCINLEGDANFGHLDDYANLSEALGSPAAKRLFSELANGVNTKEVCRLCLAEVGFKAEAASAGG